MKHTLFGLAASLTLVGATHASVLLDGFESYTGIGSDMDGKGNWLVSNGAPDVLADGPVAILDSSNWVGGGAQAATVGGITPSGLGLTSLFDNTLDVSLASLTPQPTYFLIETQLAGADEGSDSAFQFVLSSSGVFSNLLTIDFTPDAPGVWNVSWNSGYASGFTFGTLNAGAVTDFRLDTWESAPNVVSYVFSNGGSEVSSGVLAGALPTDVINGFAVNADANAGNGYITIDNVAVIPEPSSALLGLLGASFLFRRRRA